MEEPRSRRSLLAAAGAVTLVAGCGGTAGPAKEPAGKKVNAPGDREVVAFALTLEYFEADFYERLVREQLISGRDGELVKRIADDEAAHVEALEKTLRKYGGQLPDRPSPNFDRLLDGGPKAIIARASEIENVGAAAYLGQASRIQSREVLAAALSIHAVEARHASVLAHRAGLAFVPDGALASPLSRDDVLSRVEPYLN
ncbi:MAG TPA: ferritin-like domain-containing protein [Solirubrobacteraceae bacterium]|jgi:rubrerythrin